MDEDAAALPRAAKRAAAHPSLHRAPADPKPLSDLVDRQERRRRFMAIPVTIRGDITVRNRVDPRRPSATLSDLKKFHEAVAQLLAPRSEHAVLAPQRTRELAREHRLKTQRIEEAHARDERAAQETATT